MQANTKGGILRAVYADQEPTEAARIYPHRNILSAARKVSRRRSDWGIWQPIKNLQ